MQIDSDEIILLILEQQSILTLSDIEFNASETGLRLTQTAQHDLRHLLARRLLLLFREILMREMNLLELRYGMFITNPSPGMMLLEKYDKGDLTNLLLDYPSASELYKRCVYRWKQAVRNLLTRLAQDFSDLKAFGIKGGEPISHIHEVDADFHQGGAAVRIIEFTSGHKVVYKPRRAGADDFSRFIDLFNNITGLPIQVPRCIGAGEYFWQEFVPHTEHSQSELPVYFYRIGVLLGLAFCCGASDLHSSNIVASKGFPVIIDAETFLSPALFDRDVAGHVDGSVLNTGILPKLEFWPDGRWYDLSALGNFDDAINAGGEHLTDLIRSQLDTSSVRLSLPYKSDPISNPVNFLSEIRTGFLDCTQAILHKKDDLTSALISSLSGTVFRFVYRPTRVYSAILEYSLTLEQLAGNNRTNCISELLLKGLKPADRGYVSAITVEELHSLLDLDIPYFEVPAKSHGIFSGGKEIDATYFALTPLENAARRFRALSRERTDLEARVIEDSLIARFGQRKNSAYQHSVIISTTADSYISKASQLAEYLISRALPLHEKAISWVGAGITDPIGRINVDLVGSSLYSGTCGIAIFLAAAFRCSGEERFAEAALSAVHPIINEDLNFSGESLKPIGFGIADGISGWIFSLLCLNNLLSDSACLDTAQHLADSLSVEMFDDKLLDTFIGPAGAIMSLLELYQVTKCSKYIEKAKLLGAGLNEQLKALPAPEGHGYAHGRLGLLDALERLTFHAPELQGKLNTSILERQFDAEYSIAWCSGVIGYGCVELRRYRYGMKAADEVLPGIEAAVNACIRHDFVIDHLCCGLAGALNMVSTAAEAFGREDWRHWASEQSIRLMRRDAFRFYPGVTWDLFTPSLFRGLAGIGLTYLHCGGERVPNPLTFEIS